jgi:integrase/recombinase XerD
MTTLRERMIQDMRIRNYSPHTVDAYVRCAAAFAKHFGKSPEYLGPKHVRCYQRYLVEERKIAWSRFNQTVCALRFLYRVTLDRDWMINHLPHPRGSRKLPVVLSLEELSAFLAAVKNLKHRTVLQTMYGAGLRISEALNLRIDDIDSQRGVLRISQAKGKKDRYAPLSPTVLDVLRAYWKAYRPTSWLFPGRSPDHSMTSRTIQSVCKCAADKAGLSKPVTPHTMRHCFATHLLEAGTDLRTIQHLLGHRGMGTTAVYLHIAGSTVESARRSLDLLGTVVQPSTES